MIRLVLCILLGAFIGWGSHTIHAEAAVFGMWASATYVAINHWALRLVGSRPLSDPR